MKVAVIADVHSNYLCFKRAIDDAIKRKVERFIFLGDYTTDGFDADKVIKDIKKLDYYAINGNRDLDMLDYHNNKYEDWDKYLSYSSKKYGYDCLSGESIEFLQGLDIYKIITLENKKICMSHSSPYSVRGDVYKDSYDMFDKLIEDFNCDIYLFGHEHKSYCTYYRGRYFINPSSVGLTSCEIPFKYGILDINDNSINYESIDINCSYDELLDYYSSSDYSKLVKEWSFIILQCFKDGGNHQTWFSQMIRKEAEKRGIDISLNIPDDLYLEVFDKYKNSLIKSNEANRDIYN